MKYFQGQQAVICVMLRNSLSFGPKQTMPHERHPAQHHTI